MATEVGLLYDNSTGNRSIRRYPLDTTVLCFGDELLTDNPSSSSTPSLIGWHLDVLSCLHPSATSSYSRDEMTFDSFRSMSSSLSRQRRSISANNPYGGPFFRLLNIPPSTH